MTTAETSEPCDVVRALTVLIDDAEEVQATDRAVRRVLGTVQDPAAIRLRIRPDFRTYRFSREKLPVQ